MYAHAEVLYAVADDEQGYLHHHIVTTYLIKSLLADADVWSFEFEDYLWISVLVVEYGIGTALHTVLL